MRKEREAEKANLGKAKKPFVNVKIYDDILEKVEGVRERFPRTSLAAFIQNAVEQMVELMQSDPKKPREVPPLVRQSDAALVKTFFNSKRDHAREILGDESPDRGGQS